MKDKYQNYKEKTIYIPIWIETKLIRSIQRYNCPVKKWITVFFLPVVFMLVQNVLNILSSLKRNICSQLTYLIRFSIFYFINGKYLYFSWSTASIRDRINVSITCRERERERKKERKYHTFHFDNETRECRENVKMFSLIMIKLRENLWGYVNRGVTSNGTSQSFSFLPGMCNVIPMMKHVIQTPATAKYCVSICMPREW